VVDGQFDCDPAINADALAALVAENDTLPDDVSVELVDRVGDVVKLFKVEREAGGVIDWGRREFVFICEVEEKNVFEGEREPNKRVGDRLGEFEGEVLGEKNPETVDCPSMDGDRLIETVGEGETVQVATRGKETRHV